MKQGPKAAVQGPRAHWWKHAPARCRAAGTSHGQCFGNGVVTHDVLFRHFDTSGVVQLRAKWAHLLLLGGEGVGGALLLSRHFGFRSFVIAARLLVLCSRHLHSLLILTLVAPWLVAVCVDATSSLL